MIDLQIINQVTRKLDEIRSGLNSQTLEAINSTITDNVLPTIQCTLSKRERENTTMVDRRSGWLHRSPEYKNAQETVEYRPEQDLNSVVEVTQLGKSLNQSSENDYDSMNFRFLDLR